MFIIVYVNPAYVQDNERYGARSGQASFFCKDAEQGSSPWCSTNTSRAFRHRRLIIWVEARAAVVMLGWLDGEASSLHGEICRFESYTEYQYVSGKLGVLAS